MKQVEGEEWTAAGGLEQPDRESVSPTGGEESRNEEGTLSLVLETLRRRSVLTSSKTFPLSLCLLASSTPASIMEDTEIQLKNIGARSSFSGLVAGKLSL